MDLSGHFDGITDRDWQSGADGTVRFAMIGIGWWTRDFAVPVTEESDICETTVAVSSSTEKAQGFASEHETIEHGITYDEFLDGAATEAYDAIYVATPNALHLPYVEAAAEFDKAVLCEKPMESTVERAEALVELAESIPVMIAYRMHTDPAVRCMRELVREGFIGEPVFAHGNMSQSLLEMFPDPDQWRLDPDMAGPGTSVTDLGIYPINTSRFVLDREPETVDASMWSATEGFEDVPDERGALTVAFEDGVHGSFTASQNGYESGFLTITGTEGELELQPAFLAPTGLTISRDGVSASVDLPDVDVYYQMAEEFDYFADCLLDDRDPHPDAAHGLVDMRTIEAAFEAAASGERQEL